MHRDLKPENLLLDENRHIKIVDFGLSNTYKTGDKLKTACGSPCYAAPEMIAGQRYNGLEVDIWSTGVILFAMSCGYLPFEDSNTSKLYKKILDGSFKLPSHISPACKNIICGILNTNPAYRLKLEEIRSHPFYEQYDHNEQEGLIIGMNSVPVDDKIVKRMVKVGMDEELVN